MKVCHEVQWFLVQSGLVSRMGFLTRLKSNKVEIGKGKTSRMIIKEKLSERAVMKERRLRQAFPQERRRTPIRT